MNEIIPGKVYRHFKGNYYYVIDIALHSETKEEFVVYTALYGDNKTYIRPLKMFSEEFDSSRPDNLTGQKYRFELADNIAKDYTK
jgi:hypothetical protein